MQETENGAETHPVLTEAGTAQLLKDLIKNGWTPIIISRAAGISRSVVEDIVYRHIAPGPRLREKISLALLKMRHVGVVRPLEASKLLGVSAPTVYRALRKGQFPNSHKLGRWLIPISDLTYFRKDPMGRPPETRKASNGEYVRQTEAAKMLGVSRQRVSQLLDEGAFPLAVQMGSKEVWVIPKADVEMRAQTQATSDERTRAQQILDANPEPVELTPDSEKVDIYLKSADKGLEVFGVVTADGFSRAQWPEFLTRATLFTIEQKGRGWVLWCDTHIESSSDLHYSIDPSVFGEAITAIGMLNRIGLISNDGKLVNKSQARAILQSLKINPTQYKGLLDLYSAAVKSRG